MILDFPCLPYWLKIRIVSILLCQFFKPFVFFLRGETTTVTTASNIRLSKVMPDIPSTLDLNGIASKVSPVHSTFAGGFS